MIVQAVVKPASWPRKDREAGSAGLRLNRAWMKCAGLVLGAKRKRSLQSATSHIDPKRTSNLLLVNSRNSAPAVLSTQMVKLERLAYLCLVRSRTRL
jgi:hypothetical protein